jgi:hypothetical protein
MQHIAIAFFIGSIFLHTLFQDDFSILKKWEPPFTEKQKLLLEKNERKIMKICSLVKCGYNKNLSAKHIRRLTFYKYHYDVIRPIRRLVDANHFVHFSNLQNVKKCFLVVKYIFYGFYYSL